jgi:hypothetical protein
VISWNTNQNAGQTSSVVNYTFNGRAQPPITGNPSSNYHEITIPDAARGKYEFTVVSANACGQSDAFQRTLCDDDEPDFNRNSISITRSDDAQKKDLIITWSTGNLESSSEVSYRLNGGSWQTVTGEFGTNHRVVIPDAPKGSYEFRVKSATLCGEDHTVTIDYCDTLANENIVISHPENSSHFSITWHTNMNTEETWSNNDDCRVDLTYPDGDSEHEHFNNGGMDHSVTFDNASARGKYHYKITATNECDQNTITEGDYCDGTLAIDSEVTIQRDPNDSDNILIKWHTNLDSDSRVKYRYNDGPERDASGNGHTRDHVVTLHNAPRGKYSATAYSSSGGCGDASRAAAQTICEVVNISNFAWNWNDTTLNFSWNNDGATSSSVTVTPPVGSAVTRSYSGPNPTGPSIDVPLGALARGIYRYEIKSTNSVDCTTTIIPGSFDSCAPPNVTNVSRDWDTWNDRLTVSWSTQNVPARATVVLERRRYMWSNWASYKTEPATVYRSNQSVTFDDVSGWEFRFRIVPTNVCGSSGSTYNSSAFGYGSE